MTRSSWTAIVMALVVGTVIAGSAAGAPAANYPARIDFPATQFDGTGTAVAGTGYSPEGIAVSGDTFYAGSTATGEIIKGNLKTGVYDRNFVPASPNQPSDLHRGGLGLLVDDHNRLWFAGSYGMACGAAGQPACPAGLTTRTNYGVAFVYDATTGAQLAQYTLSTAAAKTINDLTISGNAVYFSNTTAPAGAGTEVQFKLQLGPGGALPPGDVPPPAPGVGTVNPAVTPIPTPNYTGADGIDTLPNGNIIMNSVNGASLGDMVVINRNTNAVSPIIVQGEPGRAAKALLSGDGVALDGNILYYPENRTDTATCPDPTPTLLCVGDIAVIRLNPPDYTTAQVLTRLNSPAGIPPLRSPANTEQLGHFVYVISRVLQPNPVTGALNVTQTFIERLDKRAATASAGSARSTTEGGTVSGVLATGTDVSTAALTATIDWGDGSTPSTGTLARTGEAFTISGSHTYADNGAFTVTATAVDAATAIGVATATTTATVTNVAPSVSISTPTSGATFQLPDAVSVSAPFTDPGTKDAHTCSIDWGDGAKDTGTVTESGGSGTCTGTHTYSVASQKTIAVTVTDNGGGAATANVAVVSVAAPAAAGCVVPNVKGKTLAAAAKKIKAAKCGVGRVTKARSTKSKRGHVLAQKPAAGTNLAAGGKVRLVVGK